MNHDRTVRLARLIACLILSLVLLFACNACSTLPTHNANGGYIDACGDEPGMIGDDC